MPFDENYNQFTGQMYGLSVNRYQMASAGMTVLVKCFDVESAINQDNKMFEILSTTKYKELQELVNKKYGNVPILLAYIDEMNE